MTFEGHTDRAPRLLPHREQGEALLAIREAAPTALSEESIDLFAVPAGEVQGHGFDLSRFHRLSRLPAAPNGSVSPSTDGPPDAARLARPSTPS
ncbi:MULTISPECIES: hypothetical protein [unclassified Streptomyces]|uniref:hypothetical protein n=1 Tax=unclassified Streptomyces TaxID=2593676 RepID=UPI002E2D6E24|nr:hypothetical protein [Streptomyces sp. NBC_00223]